MKNGKKPTRNQKKTILAAGLNPNNWIIVKKQDHQWELVHRETGQTKIINL